MKRKRLTVVCWLAACLLSFPAQAEQIEFVLIGNGGIGLLPSNVTPPTSSTGFGGEGDIGIIFDTGTNDLTIDIEWGSANGYGDLTGEITNLHLHGPTDDPPPNSYSQTGDLLLNLGQSLNFDSSATSGGLTDVFFISNADVPGLLGGRTYINVHTAMYEFGEIRGYLVRADAIPEPGFVWLLSTIAIGIFARRRH